MAEGTKNSIKLTVRQAQRWMHQLGYRLKRAGYSYLQASSDEARQFQRTLKKLRNLGPRETVVSEDETGFILHPRLGFWWAKRGRRLKVPTASNHHKRLNLFGWAAPLLGRAGLTPTPTGNREGFLACLQTMYRRLHGYTIWLYVDGAGWHKGKEVDVFLQTHPRLHLTYLPRYQPGLNPQEHIWRRVRYEATTNRWFENIETIWSTVQKTTYSWSPRKIKQLCQLS